MIPFQVASCAFAFASLFSASAQPAPTPRTVSSALKNLYPPPSPPGSNLPASLRLCVEIDAVKTQRRKWRFGAG